MQSLSEKICELRFKVRRGKSVSLLVWSIVFGSSLLTVGCSNRVTTWSTEVRSPDGSWLATARPEQWSGPGNAYDATTVSLKRKDSSEATDVVVLSHQYDRIVLTLKWPTPTHLEVSVAPSKAGDKLSLDYQVARMAGVDVTVRQDPIRE